MVDAPTSEAKRIFLEAVELGAPDAWSQFLDNACSGDALLRQRVEKLLAAHAQSNSLLDGNGLVATIDPPATERSGSLIGPYKLHEQIGEGGMGLVYMAEQQRPVRRLVALKVVKPGMDSKQVIARFEAERQALAMMDHPNIARVLDAGTTEAGRPYFVMELVRGIQINEFCDQKRLTVRQRLALFIQVCHAVQHAHQKGIIHRDLKPTNVLVTLHDTAAVPKVIDFGIAKALGQQLTDHTLLTGFAQMIGTPLYMSPEQAEMNQFGVDTRSDVYSLGVMLYELLTGTTPFDKETLTKAGLDEMRRIIREQDPPRPSARLSTLEAKALSTVSDRRNTDPRRISITLRGELDWIVMKALEKDRSHRYESASAFAADIQRYLDDESVLACPPSAAYRFHKFARKHRAAFTTALLLAASLLLGTTISVWQAIRATQAKTQALAAVTAEEAAKQKALVAAEGERQARLAAEASEKQARASEADTSAFSRFLVSGVLAAARPKDVQQGLGVDVTMAQALEEAEKRLDVHFSNQPKAEALTRHAIGVTWRNLGRFEQAEKHLRRAVELREQELGADHPDTLDSRNSLGVVLSSMGRYDESKGLFEQTLQLRTAKLGPEHPSTLMSMSNLAMQYERAGKPDLAALAIHLDTLNLRKAKLGPQHPDTLRSMDNLAFAYLMAGKLDQALPMLEETLNLKKAQLGAEHPDTLGTMSYLGHAYFRASNLDQALALLEETLQLRQARLGPQHPDTLTSMTMLAMTYLDAGKLDQALPMLEETLNLKTAIRGPEHPETLKSMRDLALAYQRAGRLDEALSLGERTLNLQKAKFGNEHADTIASMHNLAASYREAKDFAKAEALDRESLPLHQSILGREHPQTLNAMAGFGATLLHQEKYDEAEPLLRQSVTTAERIQPDAWYIFGWKSRLGGALVGQARALRTTDAAAAQKKLAEAELLLLAGYEGQLARLATAPRGEAKAKVTEAAQRLVELYTEWNKPDEAAKWRMEFETRTTKQPTPEP